MGSVSRVFKKVKKAVKRPISKITKGIAKGIAKVGKSVMRGVAKLNKKLGPLGTIALSMAMPYALSGLSAGFNAMAANTGTGAFSTFIRATGQMGVNIGRGYNAISGQISKGFSNITSRITKGFSNLGKGNNIFSRISNGVKNLYTKAKTNFGNTFGKKGTAGKVEVFSGTADGPMLMDVEAAAAKLQSGAIDASQLGTQTAGSKSGFFTKQLTSAQKSAQDLVSKTINDAYADTLSGYSDNAMRFFSDVKKQAIAEGTYVNDFQVGELLKGNGLNQNVGYKNIVADMGDEGTRFLRSDFDITNSKNYQVLGDGKGYKFTGNDMFKTPKGTSTITKKLKDVAMGKADSLLKGYRDLDEIPAPYMIGPNQDMTMQTSTTGFGGTDIEGSQGGNFIAAVYGDENANAVRNYYKKMNILGDYA
tara:strand:- start:1 stop:1260 length:1260 start_codon:yes stop_codon:yes gene_type:complete